MRYECRVTVLEAKVFPDLQKEFLEKEDAGPCPFYQKGDTFVFKKVPSAHDFSEVMGWKFCSEAWAAIHRYVYAALQGGSVFTPGWSKEENVMISCCNDGTRPVIFKIERIDVPQEE